MTKNKTPDLRVVSKTDAYMIYELVWPRRPKPASPLNRIHLKPSTRRNTDRIHYTQTIHHFGVCALYLHKQSILRSVLCCGLACIQLGFW